MNDMKTAVVSGLGPGAIGEQQSAAAIPPTAYAQRRRVAPRDSAIADWIAAQVEDEPGGQKAAGR